MVFSSEKQLDAYKDKMLEEFFVTYDISPHDIIRLDDMAKTLMAEYSRLLSEGKIKRPYTYSAQRGTDDTSNKLGKLL